MKKQNFERALSTFKNLKVGIFLHDNQFLEGILLDVKQDHLVVSMDDNVFYFALHQIHALSRNAKNFHISSENATYIDRTNLEDILNNLKYNWVTINGLGNQTFIGLLSRIGEDHIVLVKDEEQLYIQKCFISNIYKGSYETAEQLVEIDQDQDKAIQDSSELNHASDTNEEQRVTNEIKETITNRQENTDSNLLESDESENESQNHSVLQVDSTPDISEEATAAVQESIPSNENEYSEQIEPIKQYDQKVIEVKSYGYTINTKKNSLKKSNESQLDAQELDKGKDSPSELEHQVLESNKEDNLRERLNEDNRIDYEPDMSQNENSDNQNYSDQELELLKFNNLCHKKRPSIERRKKVWTDKQDSIESHESETKNNDHEPVKKMSEKEEKAMLEKQYYTLMMHARKMYNQLRNERLGR